MEKLVYFQCHGIITKENVILMSISFGQDTMAYIYIYIWAHLHIHFHSGTIYIDKGDNRGRSTLSTALEEIHSLTALSPGDES